jgi:hypothetical protein
MWNFGTCNLHCFWQKKHVKKVARNIWLSTWNNLVSRFSLHCLTSMAWEVPTRSLPFTNSLCKNENAVWFLLRVLWFCLHVQRVSLGSRHSHECQSLAVGLGPVHTAPQALSPEYDMDAYMATFIGGEAWDLCWKLGQTKSYTHLSTKSCECFCIN